MNALMRGHGPGALCEICDKRPGVRMAHGCGLEAWSCGHCSGDDEIDEQRAVEAKEDARREHNDTDGFSNGAIAWD